jgi:transposase
MQKAMQEMGVHLHVVVSEVCGDTGLRIIDAILAGPRAPAALVKLRDARICKSTPAPMEAALPGNWREELLFVLGQSRQSYQFIQGQIERLDERIMLLLAQLPEAPGVPREPTPRPATRPPGRTLPRPRKRNPKRWGPAAIPCPETFVRNWPRSWGSI